MQLAANWSYPNTIKIGAGRIRELAKTCRAAGINKPLLVTDRGLAALPITANTLDILETAGLGRAVFNEVDPNPNENNLAAGIAMFNEGGHDGVVAFGGGSALDLGKLVAVMAGQTMPVWDFTNADAVREHANTDVMKPIIAVPTTAGTGSEVGRGVVLTNSNTAEKIIILHPKLLPAVALCDPELTLGMPRTITVGTGMDAFAHALEAYSSPLYHPMSQGIALEGMRLVKENLPKVFADGADIEARTHMMAAASMGAVAFQKGLGAIHALSHPIGAVHHTHHGTTNAVVMRQVLAFNRPAIEDSIARAANYLGIEGGFDGFDAFVGELNALLGIPANLSALGVTNPDIGKLTEAALRDLSVASNPVEMTPENTSALFEACMS